MVALPCGSRSTMSTRWPTLARPAARFTVVVVLPTPPFWFAMQKMCGMRALSPQGRHGDCTQAWGKHLPHTVHAPPDLRSENFVTPLVQRGAPRHPGFAPRWGTAVGPDQHGGAPRGSCGKECAPPRACRA